MSLRIVLADDHLVLRQGLRALLTQHGVQVVGEASDGRVAVELVRELRPAVAVLDIMMPLLNGIDAAHEIADHRMRVMRKLEIHDVAGLVRYAIREGLISP